QRVWASVGPPLACLWIKPVRHQGAANQCLVLVGVALVRAIYIHADVFSLLASELSDNAIKAFHHEARHLFVELFRQSLYGQQFWLLLGAKVGKGLLEQVKLR